MHRYHSNIGITIVFSAGNYTGVPSMEDDCHTSAVSNRIRKKIGDMLREMMDIEKTNTKKL